MCDTTETSQVIFKTGRKVCHRLRFLVEWATLDRRALALRLDFHGADSRLQFPATPGGHPKAFSLSGPALRDADQTEVVPPVTADLQFRILQLVLIRDDRVLKMAELIAHDLQTAARQGAASIDPKLPVAQHVSISAAHIEQVRTSKFT